MRISKAWIVAAVLLSSCAVAVGALALQTLPVTKTLSWTQPDGATAEVSGYKIVIDNAAPITVPATTACPTDLTICSYQIVISTLGTHTWSVTAVNWLGDGLPNPLTKNVNVPGKSQNLQIK